MLALGSATTPFTADEVDLPVTVTGSTGSNAVLTVNTNSSGQITSVNVVDGGTGYTLGDTVVLDETGGPGVQFFNILTVV